MTDTKTTDEISATTIVEGEISMTVDVVDETIAEEIAAAILERLTVDTADGIPSDFLATVEAVLTELEERKARERAKGKIDIEAVVDDLELGDLKLLEATTGQKLGKILREFETRDFGADTIAGIVLVALRRDNPEATIEDADKIKLAAIAGEEEDEEGEDEEAEDEEADPR